MGEMPDMGLSVPDRNVMVSVCHVVLDSTACRRRQLHAMLRSWPP